MNSLSDEVLYAEILEKRGPAFRVLYDRYSGPLFRKQKQRGEC